MVFYSDLHTGSLICFVSHRLRRLCHLSPSPFVVSLNFFGLYLILASEWAKPFPANQWTHPVSLFLLSSISFNPLGRDRLLFLFFGKVQAPEPCAQIDFEAAQPRDVPVGISVESVSNLLRSSLEGWMAHHT